MKTKRQSRIIALLLVLSLCASMYPGIVSAAESVQVEPEQEIQFITDDAETDIAEDPALSVYSATATRKAALISVTNLGHDHYYALDHIKTNLINCGIAEPNLYTGAFATSSIDWHLANDYNEVFVSRSHGGVQMNEIFTDEQDGTYLVLNDDESYPVHYVSNDTMDMLELGNLKLAVFVGCKTAYGSEWADNLATVAVWQGAKAAVGFTQNINCNEANVWLKELFAYLEKGDTIRIACEKLYYDDNWRYTSMANYVICGDPKTTLTTS